MNEDMNMNEEIEAVNSEDIVVYDAGTEGSNGGNLLGKVLVVGGMAFAAGVAAAPKIRSKIENRRIKSLEKKGYLIVKKEPDDSDDSDVDDSADDED